MARSQAKSAVGKWQSARTRTKKRSRGRLRSNVVHFPETRGKVVEDVEFSASSDYHNISINFQDKTSLNLSIETCFTLEPDYSDWKTGNQRVLKLWPTMHSI